MKKDGDMKKYLDIISNKNIKLSERVLIPVQQYPKVSSVPGGEGGGVLQWRMMERGKACSLWKSESWSSDNGNSVF